MADDILQIEDIGAVRRLTINRPERLNALNQPLADAFLVAFEGLRRNTAVRVVVLRGAGRAFTSGADLKAGGTPEALRDGPNGDWVLRDVMKAMRSCPQPIIGLVKGPAAGAGLTFALACDVILAGESAAFHSAFIKIGLTGAELGVSWRLQRTMGISRAREVLLTGDPILAEEAARTGLVSRVVPDAELDDEGMKVAERMLAASPDALRITKRTLDAALEAPTADAAMEVEERGQMLMIRSRMKG